MAELKRIWFPFLLCLLSQCVPSLQDCSRPNPGPNVIITPDQSSYTVWSYATFSCPTGYTASGGNTYSYCYSGSPDYWSPAISTVITCTRDTSLTTPETGNVTAEAMIFVADYSDGEIYMADLLSGSLNSLAFDALPFGSVLQPLAVDYDPDTRMVYWTESSGSIRRANIDGTGQSVIVDSGVGKPEGIALDTSRGKVYWTDESLDRIASANLNGSSLQILIDTNIYRPRAIIVHQEEGVMFWTDWNYPSTIERANLDGSDRYVIVNSSLQWPNGLAFNADASRIYWCDAGTDRIESVDLWGDDRMVHLATSSIHPYDLAVVDDTIVWTDWNYDALGVTSTQNSSSYSFYYHSVFQNPFGIHVYKEVLTPTEGYVPTEMYTHDPPLEPITDDNITPRPTWWWWYTTDQPVTDDNRTPRPTWWWWYTTDQPVTDDNRTPRPTWWWWYTTDQPVTDDNRTPRPTWWWWYTTDQPITDDNRTPRPTWWWWYTTDQPTTPTPWRDTTWWDTTNNPISGTDVNVTLVLGITRTISSPNYPSNYHNNAYYNWYIRAPEGYDTLVHFLDFRTESCCDYLRIGSGDSVNSPGSVELARLYGHSVPQDIRIDTPTSWMRFTSDYSVTDRGFQLQLSLINSTSDPRTPQPTRWWNTDAPTAESSTTWWWWWGTTNYPDFTTETPLLPNETARLVNGSYPTEGRVELFSNTWGTVCDHSWDIQDATVLCRSIGYPDAVGSYYNALYGMGTGPILMDHVHCYGNENSLFDCPYTNYGGNHCSHWDDAGAVCYPDVRLVNGNNPSEGRVEVYHDGIWGTVCDHVWDSSESRVICRSLGFPDQASTLYNSYFGQGTGAILLNHVYCDGDETSIFDCQHNGIGNNHCSHYDDVGVRCQPNVRLVNGSSPNEGRVEVFHGDTWGTVCDHSWGMEETYVICRSLGYPYALQYFYNAYFGQGYGDVALSDVYCTGNESSIFHCHHAGIWDDHCSHYDDVGVRCATEEPEATTVPPYFTDYFSTYAPPERSCQGCCGCGNRGGCFCDDVCQRLGDCCPDYAPLCSEVRLVNGSSHMEGRVEVYANGVWGTVCDDYWDVRDARVVCRSMGFAGVEAAFSRAAFGQGTGPIHLDNLGCSGYESSILNCTHRGIGVHDCSHSEDAGLRCSNNYGNSTTEYPTSTLRTTTYEEDFTTRRPPTEEPATVRLVNGNEAHEGRVEVLYNGVWGTVCDDGWDMNDARVVCRSLGYRDALSAPWNARFGQGYGPIWMDNVYCSGNEEHIFDCPHNGFGNHNCGHYEDASVVCEPDEAELTCDSTSMTLIMDRTLLEIGDDARDVHFEDESCIGYDHDSQHVAITTAYDRCGTKQEQDEDYIVFSNLVTFYKPHPENGTNQLITREHYLHIPVTCYMEREQLLGDSFIPKIGIYKGEEKGYGEFSLSFDRYTNAGFYQPANDSGKVELGTPLYFGVGLNSVTNLTLLIDSCWATSSPYPLDDHRYDIIDNGCAVDSTTYIYSWLSPTFKGFRIDAFAFIGDYDQVYVHCSILICDNSDSDSRCAQGCLTRSRRSLQPTGSRSKPHTITQGPLSDASHLQHVMMVDNDYGGTGTFDPLMIAAMSALCVLIALTVIMSLVIVRIRRRHRPELIGYRRVGVTEDY